jgi:hypothetical protein
MALSAFDDRSKLPDEDDLYAVLGDAGELWTRLVDHVASEFPPLDESWVFSGKEWGWALRLKQKKRAVVYLTPCEDYFVAGFALGEKAVQAAHAAHLPDDVLAMIDTSRKYAEGRAVRVEVRTKHDLENVKQIAAVKMAN